MILFILLAIEAFYGVCKYLIYAVIDKVDIVIGIKDLYIFRSLLGYTVFCRSKCETRITNFCL